MLNVTINDGEGELSRVLLRENFDTHLQALTTEFPESVITFHGYFSIKSEADMELLFGEETNDIPTVSPVHQHQT